MKENRVLISHLIQNQLPSYVVDEFPLIVEFLRRYYGGLEFQGQPIDLINNIDSYLKLNSNANLTTSATVTYDVDETQNAIFVDNTTGFPDSFGIIQVDDEIIVYTARTNNAFVGCNRGLSAITSYDNPSNPEEAVFSSSEISAHSIGTPVKNLSVLFLQEFLKKIKKQILPGLESKTLADELNEAQFIRNSKDFYSARGTENSFKILFKALYNVDIDFIRPKDYIIAPSDAIYKISRDLVVESIEGDPFKLINKTLFQDEYENINKAYAPVSHVERVVVGTSTDVYYKLSIDNSYLKTDGSNELLYGDFSIHGKTKVIGSVGVGQTFLDVDSTFGFAPSGSLSLKFSNEEIGEIYYTSKTSTQFLGITSSTIISSILDNTPINQNTYAYAYDDETKTNDGIKVRIRSVLNKLDLPTTSYYQKPNSKIEIKALGKYSTNTKANHWFFNTAQFYNVQRLSLEDATNNTYRLVTKDSHILRIGDSVTLTDRFAVLRPNALLVVDVFDSKTCLIRGSGVGDPGEIVKVTKTISKVNTTLYPELSKVSCNVQNVYTDSDKVLVASNSLPSFIDVKINPKSQKFTLSGTFSLGQETIQLSTAVDHNFFTGDLVYYTPEKVITLYRDADGNIITDEFVQSYLFSEGTYYVKRIDTQNIKLATSLSNLYANNFISITPPDGRDIVTVLNNTLEKYEFRRKEIKPQKIYREILPPSTEGIEYETRHTYNGILINGVEILNYKSKDAIYYGKINSIEVVSGGDDYDIINPPVLNISDSLGVGATGICAVKGSFKEINIIDPGFDYIETPTISISGGNGSGAVAEAKLSAIPHQVSFNPTGLSTLSSGIGTVGFGSDVSTIGFTTYHKFRNGERVVYKTFGKNAVVGLSTDATYYVSVQNAYTVKLHKNLDDAVLGINTVVLSSPGTGVHQLKSLNGKSVLSSIRIIEPGSGYENKERRCAVTGINTSLHTIRIENHDYKTGEIIKYSVDGTTISGLSTSKEYYVTSIDKDTFKLSQVGVGTTAKDFYFNTKQYEIFSSSGVGTHIFNYPNITVEVVGKVGIASTGTDTFKAIVQPIVRGQLTSVYLTNSGVGYGSSEVLNFRREPELTLRTGTEGQLEPVVIDGKIVDVVINNRGREYNSPPQLIVSGIGSGANLTPKISNGALIGININKTGVGYGSSTTTITVKESGNGVKFRVNLQKWNVNNFGKNLLNITNDDVIVSPSTNEDYQLQCSFLYAPRSLRKVVYSIEQNGNPLYGQKDLQIVNDQEINNTNHSSIIGWSYDGYPIYGPYGYKNKNGGEVTQIKSGYKLELKENRPPTSIFPAEFFIEDFTWTESEDESFLDKNNGRFCVTPDYPNGTYAYFATFETSNSSDGLFKNFKKPAFPYLIGNSFRSKPNEFNFLYTSNQDQTELNGTKWRRNTYPYALIKSNSGYDYLKKPYDSVEQVSIIQTTKKGNIETVGILTGGNNYQVNDQIIFESEPNSNFFSASRVSKVLGSPAVTVSAARTEVSNIEFYPFGGDGNFIGFSTTTHQFINGEILTVSGLSTTSSFVEGSYEIGISTNRLTVSKFIGTDGATGIVTYLSVVGNLEFPNIRENDILGIGTGVNLERVKVLNVDKISSRIRILRAVNNVVGVSHTISTAISEVQRKFTINVGYKTTFDNRINREYYFNPKESVGLGATAGVGIGTTIFFSNPGAGVTQLFVPSQAIYLPNHKLKTGDVVTYKTNGGDPIGVSTVSAGSSFTLTNNAPLFVANIDVDFIGLSTVKVGLGTTGTYVGIASTTSSFGLLYFVGLGTGNYHSLVNDYPNVVKGKVNRNLVTVSTSNTHGLLKNDTVFVDVNPSISTSITIKYNAYNRKVVVDSLDFVAAGVGTTANTINLNEHGLVTGQKVIHTATSPVTGLVNNKEYYTYVIDKDTIKLCGSKYETQQNVPNFVNLESQSSGSLLPVNPPLKFYRDSIVTFDVSDASLSYTIGSIKYSAFQLKFYTDFDFFEEYNSSGISNVFDVTRSGTVGTSGATVTLKVNENTPDILYYKLVPLFVPGNLKENLEIVVDDEVDLHSQILPQTSIYNGSHVITGITTNTFNYTVSEYPESSSYSSSTSIINYSTNSTRAYGPIFEIESRDRRNGYSVLPGISTIKTTLGTGAVLIPSSTSIGKVEKTRIENIGFDYPTDLTLSPEAKLPQVLEVSTFYRFKNVGLSSAGRGYTVVAPSLVVLDGDTKKKINDIELQYVIGSNTINIKRNTFSLTNTTPTIIPVGNPNGVRVSNLQYNDSNQTVKATLADTFSEDFPISVGDKVLVEYASVGVASTAKGYNSSEYDYALFTVTQTHPNLGGPGAAVTYSFSGYLGANQYLGTFDTVTSSAVLVPQKYFPQFTFELESNSFQKGNLVVSEDSVGTVFDWDGINNKLVVESGDDFVVGNTITEPITDSRARITKVYSFDTNYNLDYFSIVQHGWDSTKGFLNDNQQKIQDNDYYQNFSYSIKSKIPIQEWNDAVSSLVHTAGFKKFSDLQIESTLPEIDNNFLVIKPKDATTIAVDIIGEEDLNCVHDFDLATENFLRTESTQFSDQINFKTRIISDYEESVGNRVLTIDDFSSSFNSNPRSTPYTEIFRQPLNDGVSQKFLVYIKDRLYTAERQVALVTCLNDIVDGIPMINQYGFVNTVLDLGYFDYSIDGSEGVLEFYPTKYELNNYNVSVLSFNLDRLGISTTTVGIASTTIGISTTTSFPGALVSVATSNISISGTTTTEMVRISGIGTETAGVRSAKILVTVESGDKAEFDELSVIHDGTDVKVLEYGQLSIHSIDAFSSSGLGTYGISLSGSDIVVTYTPIAGLTTTKVNTVTIGLSSENYRGSGTYDFTYSQLVANGVSIASTSSPVAVGIGSYGDDYDGAYSIVQVSDTTNNVYSFSELMLVDDGSQVSVTEFGSFNTLDESFGPSSYTGLGTFGVEIVGNRTELKFTPNANIDVSVKTYIQAIGIVDNTAGLIEKDLSSASINNKNSVYTGTLAEIKRDFPLLHKGYQIFERNFVGTSSTVVNLSDNTITLPNHFFVSGEELTYSTSLGIGTDAIGIASTSFSGIGITNRLPASVYCIKVDENKIRLATSAENALKKNPVAIGFTGVGIGNSHTFTAKNQNQKVLISIDNALQSPIAGSSVTTTLARATTVGEDVIYFTGITSFFGADYVKVDDEVMKILSVGIGSTNAFKVTRAWLGTRLAGHSTGAPVTKIRGNYNIVGNTLNFIEAPYGKNPISTSTAPPEYRDWTGITTSSSFHGRSFMRRGYVGTSSETYTKNYLYDDITELFTGQRKTFSLTSNKENVIGISTNLPLLLINGILQAPGANYNFTASENLGITSITFTGTASSVAYDVNNANIPVGGVIVSVGSTSGFGFQPLVAAGGTAIVSASGTIQSISIGNSGSGYRAGIQTVVSVGVGTSSTGTPRITSIGTAAISNGHIVSVAITNPGAGFTSSNPPYVVFDAPLSYTNIPLIYSSASPGAGGTQAKVDIVVGQGSSVIDFNITNTGFGYGVGQVLTVGIGGTVGIPTDPSISYQEFQLTIDQVDADQFTAWSVGQIDVLDDFSSLFNGSRVTFPISQNGNSLSIVSKPGSNISIQDTLFIFINDILQVPGEAYEFTGGSQITFSEAPKSEDTLKFLFYRGTGGLDVQSIDITETIKVGDDVRLEHDASVGQEPYLDQSFRTVSEIDSSSSLNTNPYLGPGLSGDTTLLRPLTWCKQMEDRFIGGKIVDKTRDLYKANIFPTAYITKSVGIGSTIVYVDNLRPFFNPLNENVLSVEFQKDIVIFNHGEKVAAAATAIVSSAGTVSSIVISTGGVGYTTSPDVTIQNPVGVGTSQRATATATISAGGTVQNVTVTSPGTGYTQTNPPLVLIGPPTFVKEPNTVVSFAGDFGVITGIGTTTVGVASTGITFDLVIEATSTLRNNTTITSQTTVSGISTGDYFIIYDSNVGSGVTSLDENGQVIGIGTTCLDNIYRVATVSTASTSAIGFGSTTVARVTVSVSNYNGFSASGLALSSFYGRYSWGKIVLSEREEDYAFNAITSNGVSGITTGPYVIRKSPMKTQGYS